MHQKDLFYGPEGVFATRNRIGNEVRFLHKDHLGTPRLLTNHLGNTVGRHDYYPFGLEAPRSGQADEPTKKYTGHERDPHGLADYMLGRTYLYPFMRFATPDPARDGWSLYAYTGNNPVNYVDPDGEVVTFPDVSSAEDTSSLELETFKAALVEAGASDLAEQLSLKAVDGVVQLVSGVDLRKSSNPTAQLIGEAIATDTVIDVTFGKVKKKFGGAVTKTQHFDTLNEISIRLDPKQISSSLVPGHAIVGGDSGPSVALSVSLPTALVHELGHAYGNFGGGQSGRFGNTVPYALRYENRHRALSPKPTYRTEHCGLYPKNGCRQ